MVERTLPWLTGSISSFRKGSLRGCRAPFFLCRVRTAVLGFLFAVAPLVAEAQSNLGSSDATIRIMRLPSGLRYGVMGASNGHPAPTVFAFEGSIEDMQREPAFTEASRILVRHGVLSVFMDTPVHGEDHRLGEAGELKGWRERVDRGQSLIGSFAENASKVLDHLIQEGDTDPSRVGAYGTSRGGFMAFHLAALDRRIKVVAGISPVTDLAALREFQGTTHTASVESLALVHQVPALAGRPVWISIGNHDKRVETDRAIAFARALVNFESQGRPDDAVIPVDLLVGPTPGHTRINHAGELLADWILQQFSLR